MDPFSTLILLPLISGLMQVSYTSVCTQTGRKSTNSSLLLFSCLCTEELTFKFEFPRCVTAQTPTAGQPIRIPLLLLLFSANQRRACRGVETSLYDERPPDSETVNTAFTMNQLCSNVSEKVHSDKEPIDGLYICNLLKHCE